MKTIKTRFPENRARRYQAFLLATLKLYHDYIKQTILPRLAMIYTRNFDGANRDSYSLDILILMQALEAYGNSFENTDRARVEEEAVQLQLFSRIELAAATAAVLERQVSPQSLFQGIRGSRGQERTQDILRAWSIENVKLIGNMRRDETEAISGIITRGFSQGLGLSEIEADIRDRVPMTRRRAKLIARNEVGNLSGALNKAEAERLDLPTYQWFSGRDERVRPSHRAMDGKICRWDDATVYKDSVEDTVWKSRASIGGVESHPGLPIRCRCTSASIIDV